MYVYIRSEPTLWTTGFYRPDGEWERDSDHGSAEEAARRAAWLNGATPLPTGRGVEVSFSRYRLDSLPGVGRDGARLIDPATGTVVALIEAIPSGWAIQLHPSGGKLGIAEPDEELSSAVKRAEAAIDAWAPTADEAHHSDHG